MTELECSARGGQSYRYRGGMSGAVADGSARVQGVPRCPLERIEQDLRAQQESVRLGTIECSQEIRALVYALSPDGLQEAAARRLRDALSRVGSAGGSQGRALGFLRAAIDRLVPPPEGDAMESADRAL